MQKWTQSDSFFLFFDFRLIRNVLSMSLALSTLHWPSVPHSERIVRTLLAHDTPAGGENGLSDLFPLLFSSLAEQNRPPMPLLAKQCGRAKEQEEEEEEERAATTRNDNKVTCTTTDRV